MSEPGQPRIAPVPYRPAGGPTPSLRSPAPGEATPARKPKRVWLDWATALQRTFAIDVWTCHCGGRRTVRAIVTHRATAEAMLRNMGLASAPTPQPASHSPPQLSLSM